MKIPLQATLLFVLICTAAPAIAGGRVVTQVCSASLTHSSHDPFLSLITLNELLKTHPNLQRNTRFLKRAKKTIPQLPSLIADMVKSGRVDELKRVNLVIEVFGDTMWFGPAAKWYMKFVALNELSEREKNKRIKIYISELRQIIHFYLKLFEGYENDEIKWIAKKQKPILPLRAYLFFMPVLSRILTNQEADVNFEPLWIIFQSANDRLGSILYNLPRITEHLGGVDQHLSKPFEKIFDEPIDDILSDAEWNDEARALLAHYRAFSQTSLRISPASLRAQ